MGLREAAELAQRMLDAGIARDCLERWKVAARSRATTDGQ
jgi:hypothetical protein